MQGSAGKGRGVGLGRRGGGSIFGAQRRRTRRGLPGKDESYTPGDPQRGSADSRRPHPHGNPHVFPMTSPPPQPKSTLLKPNPTIIHIYFPTPTTTHLYWTDLIPPQPTPRLVSSTPSKPTPIRVDTGLPQLTSTLVDPTPPQPTPALIDPTLSTTRSLRFPPPTVSPLSLTSLSQLPIISPSLASLPSSSHPPFTSLSLAYLSRVSCQPLSLFLSLAPLHPLSFAPCVPLSPSLSLAPLVVRSLLCPLPTPPGLLLSLGRGGIAGVAGGGRGRGPGLYSGFDPPGARTQDRYPWNGSVFRVLTFLLSMLLLVS